MRRVAAELGAGTMTLYHYVHDKEELVALMDDAIMGELLVPDDELPGDWREALIGIARRSRAAQRRHPWAAESLRGARIGPNGMKHVDQSLAAVAGLAIDPQAQLEIVMMVDDYINGFSAHAQEAEAEEIRPDDMAYAESLIDTGRYPHFARLSEGRGIQAIWDRFLVLMTDEDRFERGLSRLLDGIELDLRRRGALG
jgi:AcrR family transcriptional regulator